MIRYVDQESVAKALRPGQTVFISCLPWRHGCLHDAAVQINTI